jgi:hypothetical protein
MSTDRLQRLDDFLAGHLRAAPSRPQNVVYRQDAEHRAAEAHDRQTSYAAFLIAASADCSRLLARRSPASSTQRLRVSTACPLDAPWFRVPVAASRSTSRARSIAAATDRIAKTASRPSWRSPAFGMTMGYAACDSCRTTSLSSRLRSMSATARTTSSSAREASMRCHVIAPVSRAS